MRDFTGEVVSHYRVIQSVGRGGMGVVYKAADSRLRRTIAHKFLPPALTTNQDFRTISDFRKRHLEALHHLFVEILNRCQEAGLVKFGHLSLDGTKVKANASKHKAMSYGRMKQDISRPEQEIARLRKEADNTDRREDKKYDADKRGDELPEELARLETRLAKIIDDKRALEEEAKRNKDDNDTPASGPPMAKVKRVKDGKAGKETPPDTAQRNLTDPDSRIMVYKKSFIQGYHAQVVVDSEHQIIVATDVTNSPRGDSQLKYMVKRLPRKPDVFTADAGYASKENAAYLKKRMIDTYICCGREKHGLFDDHPPRGVHARWHHRAGTNEAEGANLERPETVRQTKGNR